ncbi:MAG: heparinase [Clostridiaceae bacterium]|nr:heparinase [Clostridiaceae bacterium]
MRNSIFGNKDRHFFFDNPKELAQYVRNNCGHQKEEVISVANDIANQVFTFTLRWDMERTEIPVVFEGEIDWVHQPGEDPEWVYAFNRMRYWICLGQAYSLTGDEKYAQAFVNQLCHWIRNVKKDDPKNAKAWRSIEVGLRLEYWQKAMQYFKASEYVTDEVAQLYISSITEQAEFIMGVWDTYNLMSNWGVLANHGLFMAGAMLPETERAREYLTEAIRRLELEIRMQVYRDGFHWEQSPMYHNEVLHCYLDVAILAQRNEIQLPELMLKKIRDMAYVDLLAAKPDHNELSMGDSDQIDQRDLITKAAIVFKDGALKAGGYEVPDFDTIWDIGEHGLKEYEHIVSLTPDKTDEFFEDSGNSYFRSSWDRDATYLHFHCGTLGAGHGHADKLHVDLFSREEDLLIDSGRYTYVFSEGRTSFKELRAHNTIMVDDTDLYVCKDSWECEKLTRAVNHRYYSNESYGYAEGGHLGYISHGSGVFVNRRLIFLKPDIIVIADELYASENDRHSYKQFFHFNNYGTLAGKNNYYIYESKKVRAQVRMLADNLTSRVCDFKLSRNYNKSEDAKFIETSFSARGFASAYTVISLSSPQNTEELNIQRLPVKSNFKGITFRDSQIEALNIRVGEHFYTLVIAHEEFASPTDTFLADGCVGFGNVAVFNRSAGEKEIGTVLVW